MKRFMICLLVCMMAATLVASWQDTGNTEVDVLGAYYEEPQNRKSAEEKTFIVMTYNIHRGVNMDGQLDIMGIAQEIKNSGADIVSLQEVERHSIRTRFQDQIQLLAEELSMNFSYGKSIHILNGEYGNAILSKFPIHESVVLELSSKGEKRTLLKSVVDYHGHSLDVYSTHLGLNAEERSWQFAEIFDVLRESIHEFILMGDFNTTRFTLGDLADFAYDAAKAFDAVDIPTFESKVLSARIDYIVLSNGLEAQSYEVIKSRASDHYPVVSKVKIK